MSDFVRELAIFSCLLFTSFCFWKVGVGLTGGVDASVLPSAQAAIHSSVTPQRFQTTPIQKMRPGMRVLGRNPDRWDTQPVVEPDPVSWRLVSVRMEQQPGKFVLGQLMRSTSWIRQNNALPGAVIQLEIPEMHVAGDAEVLSIAECPPIRRGLGSVVTGTFQHVSNEVISVFVEGEAEPIGATSQHPFWSRDRNAFVPAGESRIGEELKTALGTSTRVTSIEIRAGPETVYGLEVAGEHVYQISNAGLLVHNASVTSPYQIDTLHGPRWKDPVTGKFVKAPNYEAHNSATFARYKNELRAAMGKPHVNDSRLSGYMDELYRENASIGSGSTAAAVRHELATGGTVGGKTHSKKAEDMIIALQRWLKNNPNASSGDQSAAENVLLDMINALNGK